MIASVPTKSAAEVSEHYFRFVYSAIQIEQNQKVEEVEVECKEL